MRAFYQSARGSLCELRHGEYHGLRMLNPSSIAEGLRGFGNVDVRAIHDALHGEKKPLAAAAQDRMDRGSLVHMALLEPERLATDVAIWTGGRRQGAEWEAFDATSSGKLVVRQKDFEESMQLVRMLRNHEMVASSLSGMKSEVSMFCTDQGVDCRGRIDCIDVSHRRIVDIKTTDAGVSPDQVERTIRSMCYREKMSLYRRWAAMITGTDASDWKCWNLFLRMQPPYGINKVLLLDDALSKCETQMLDAINKYRDAIELNEEMPIFAIEHFMGLSAWECSQGGDVTYDEE